MKKHILTKEEAALVRKAYLEENLSIMEVCQKLNLSREIVRQYIKEYKLVKSSTQIQEARKKTNLCRYGTDNPSKSDSIKRKIIQVNQRKYGAPSFTATIEGKRRIAQTKQEKYGSSKYNNTEKGRQTKLERYGDPYFSNRKKYIQTMLENHGVSNGLRLKSTEQSIHKLIMQKGYNPEFEKYISNQKASENFIKGKNLSYFDLAKMFNAPYYVIQNWITRLDLKKYVNYSFVGKSHYEADIKNFLINTLSISSVISNAKILDGKEIDVYLPDYKLGIEFDGTYWHSDLFKNKKYHFEKSLLAESKGIRLIHIYQYEWDNTDTQEKIKQLLRIALGKVENRIYARNCQICQISNKDAKPFNNKTHLQGHRNAQVTYGLFYKDTLVQLMSFSRTHYNKNLRLENSWEIIRGCPGSNNIVVGGVSRLFEHFVRDYNPTCVFSYCDFNKFNGNSYEKLGMRFVGYTGPDMKYIIKGRVYNRQHGKYKNVKGLIEARLWGAGSKKYVWQNSLIKSV